MEITEEKFAAFIEEAFKKGFEDGVRKANSENYKANFERETGYKYDTYVKVKNIVDSWVN